MMEHFADRFIAAIARVGSPVCVGLDPVYDRLPQELRADDRSESEQLNAVEEFCGTVLEVVAPVVAVVKPQSAYFEAMGPGGVALYFDLVRRAKALGLIVIGDVKRNDIGSTAAAYAKAHLSGEDKPDAVTINGYLGADGITPFVDVARDEGNGVFVLVRTSNPSAKDLQDFTDGQGRTFYEHVAGQVARMGSGDRLVGASGYSCLGAVVGATYPDEARRLRRIMPKQLFLVPGYGAQGASADDCSASFANDGTGAIVNASRSVIYAHQRDEYAGVHWTEAIASAAKTFADDIARVVSKH